MVKRKKPLAFITTSLGDFALTQPINKPGVKDKNFLVQMSKQTAKKHEKELKEALVKCVETKTGAKFCDFEFDGKQLQGIEFCRPAHKLKKMAKTKEPPTIEECRADRKSDFLVVQCKPGSACR